MKVKRERTKSGSPIRSSLPLSISTPQQVAPSVLTTGFCTPASATSPALIADKTSPQRQQVHQWALAPSNFISQICPPAPASAASSLDSPYAQERRPSLKAQWEAIFPNEASDGNLTGSSCSTPFPSSYNGNQSVSPLWGTNLLPSLSISEPPYAGNTGLQLDLPGAFSLPPDITAEQNAESGSVVGGLASPAQFSFAQPALSLPSCSTSPNFEYWSPMPDGTGITPSTTPFCGLTGASTLSPPAFDATSELVQPLPQVPDLPVWWEHRHVKVKPDEDNGIPLEDFIKNLNEKKTL